MIGNSENAKFQKFILLDFRQNPKLRNLSKFTKF